MSVSLALSQTPFYTARPRIQCWYFARAHCAYQQRDGQAELTWVVGYTPRHFTRMQTVAHASTNRARR